MGRVLHTLRLAVATAELTDGQLLEAYSACRDETAFAELVRRHGPMVWGVCRRLLANREDAEDAFQATFLVLVRKPGSIRPAERVGNWLHGVAVRAARKAAQSARRRERQVECLPEPVARTEELNHDLVAVIDREVTRLPPKYRLPVVLCDLEGNTRSEAAARLGWPEGTVAGRLALGREMLARRLARLGLAVPSGVLAAALPGPEAGATAPTSLLNLTIRAAANGSFRPEATALAKGVIRAMSATRFMPLAAALLIVLGAGLALQGRPREQLEDPAGAAVAAANAVEPAKAVPSQPWIRITPAGNDKSPTMWLSPERQVWALHANNRAVFIDGRERARYEYRARSKRIEKTALTEQDARLVAPVDYVSQGLWLFGTERVVSQQRREVREPGKNWIDFDLVFWRGDLNLGTLRVDPETRLPVSLVFRSRTDAKRSMSYDCTYPGTGPADIYALGVPPETKIDDRTPPKETLRVLDAIAASRARIGDFRLVVAELKAGQNRAPDNFIVWRKGDRWRIDRCGSENQSGRTAKPPDGRGWGDPFLEKLKLSWQGPLYLCDGRTVHQNANMWRLRSDAPEAGTKWQRTEDTEPQYLLSGDRAGTQYRIASLVYPDLTWFLGSGFEFDPRPPAPAMPGCVLIKCSAEMNTREPMVAHEWYYLDPTKGYAVVRKELFELPVNAPADPITTPGRRTVRLEDYQLSPQGFWYPGTVLRSNVDLDDTPERGPGANQKDGPGVRYHSSITHYHFDFNVPLPDSLFVMDEASKSEKK